MSLKAKLAAIAVVALLASFMVVPAALAVPDIQQHSTKGVYYDANSLDSTDAAALPGPSGVTPDSRPTAAATRAAMPAADILGFAGVEESGQFVTIEAVMMEDENENEYLDHYQPVFTWNQPKYMLFATSFSSQPSPYLVNFAVNGTSKAIYNPNRAGGGQGPNQVLAAYSANDADDNAVWDLRPSVIIGNNGISDSALANLAGLNDYSPTGINYNVSNYTSLKNTVAAIGAAGNSTTAYNATVYCNFITNTFSLTQSVNPQPVFALVSGKNSNGTYVLGAAGQNGTAANNRYLEVCADAGATNLITLVDDSTEVPATTTYDNQGNVVTYGLDYADVILVGGQQSATDHDAILGQLYTNQLLGKTYFVKNNSSYGSSYGVLMNSIENAQNIARILPKIYSNIGSQRDLLAFYYKNFYHINDANLVHVMDRALDGVRNWSKTPDYSLTLEENINRLTDWTASDCGFSSTSAESTLNARYGVTSS